MVLESGSPVLLKNTSGTLSIRNQGDTVDLTMPSATPLSHTDSVHSGATANLCSTVSPSFANWGTNPGTNANIANELTYDAVLTTSGVGAAGNNTIIWNFGDSRRRTINYNSDQTLLSYISDDGNTWYLIASSARTFGTGKFQYFRLLKAGIFTMTTLHVMIYNIN